MWIYLTGSNSLVEDIRVATTNELYLNPSINSFNEKSKQESNRIPYPEQEYSSGPTFLVNSSKQTIF